LSAPVRLEVVGGDGARVVSFAGSLLCTHFGVSGPAVLDIHRYRPHARARRPPARPGDARLSGAAAQFAGCLSPPPPPAPPPPGAGGAGGSAAAGGAGRPGGGSGGPRPPLPSRRRACRATAGGASPSR